MNLFELLGGRLPPRMAAQHQFRAPAISRPQPPQQFYGMGTGGPAQTQAFQPPQMSTNTPPALGFQAPPMGGPLPPEQFRPPSMSGPLPPQQFQPPGMGGPAQPQLWQPPRMSRPTPPVQRPQYARQFGQRSAPWGYQP